MTNFYACDGNYYSSKVTKEFGENIVIPGIGLTVVFPINDYVFVYGEPVINEFSPDAFLGQLFKARNEYLESITGIFHDDDIEIIAEELNRFLQWLWYRQEK